MAFLTQILKLSHILIQYVIQAPFNKKLQFLNNSLPLATKIFYLNNVIINK